MRAAITGSSGFIGGHLRKALREGGSDVVCIDKRPVGTHRDGGAKHVEADICDREEMRKAFTGVETVFHLAAVSRVQMCEEAPREAIRTNIQGTYSILEVSREVGVHRVVFASSREVYGEPLCLPVSEEAALCPKNVYGHTKVVSEEVCEMARRIGLDVCILRLSNVYGPGDDVRAIPIFTKRALRQLPLTVYGREKIVDFVHVSTVVSAMIAAGCGAAQDCTVNIGSGNGTPLIDIARRIVRLVKSSSPVHVAAGPAHEVGSFVADVRRGERLLGCKLARESLYGLAETVESIVSGVEMV